MLHRLAWLSARVSAESFSGPAPDRQTGAGPQSIPYFSQFISYGPVGVNITAGDIEGWKAGLGVLRQAAPARFDQI